MTDSSLRTLAVAAVAAVLLAGCGSASRTPAPEEKRPAPAPAAPDLDRIAQVRLELASAYFERGQLDVALDEVNHALQAKPADAAAHGLRGLILAAKGDSQQADQSLREAVRLAPNDGGMRHNHAWFLCQQRRWDEADAQFAAALAEPTYRDPVRTLLGQGVCQGRAGRWAAADVTLTRAFEAEPQNATIAANLADATYHLGEYERARFYIRRVNADEKLATAQTLWLAMRIEHKLGQPAQVQVLGQQLKARFESSTEARLYAQGRFDD